jgi:hypothetical protein
MTVIWIPSALNDLTTLWLESDPALRSAITAATDAIDHLLQHNPEQQGESRSEERRILFVPPLGVFFRVDAEDMTVRVLHVWVFDTATA